MVYVRNNQVQEGRETQKLAEKQKARIQDFRLVGSNSLGPNRFGVIS